MSAPSLDAVSIAAAAGLTVRHRASRIIAEVAARHGLKVAVLLGRSRRAEAVLARHEAMYELRRQVGLSYPDIGCRMRRDHTTVLHGVRKHAQAHGLALPTPYEDDNRNKRNVILACRGRVSVTVAAEIARASQTFVRKVWGDAERAVGGEGDDPHPRRLLLRRHDGPRPRGLAPRHPAWG